MERWISYSTTGRDHHRGWQVRTPHEHQRTARARHPFRFQPGLKLDDDDLLEQAVDRVRLSIHHHHHRITQMKIGDIVTVGREEGMKKIH